MTFVRGMVRWEAAAGAPLTAGGAVLIPESRVLALRLPFGGVVWHRPIAVRVERAGRTERVPIRDVTRAVQLALLVAGLAGLVVVRAIVNRGTEENA